ncbi:MAG: hypothetical protein E6I70_02625 [Chloroflexi bacterium]|nr:MAG: hypothetical protein E6I70_02625 [Chloroflexota bacterium]
MNRRFAWVWGVVTVGIATVVGLVAYHAGQTAQIVTTTGADGRVIYPGYYGFGFFPLFGLFWVLLIGFVLFRFVFWRPWGRGGYGGYWHQHPHEHGESPTAPTTGKSDSPASA